MTSKITEKILNIGFWQYPVVTEKRFMNRIKTWILEK